MNKTKMTVMQAVFLAKKCDQLFNRAVNAWTRANNSGNNELMKRGYALTEKYRNEAEALLAPLGVVVDYPGLHPSFTVKGVSENTTLAAISAALDQNQKEMVAA